MGRGEPGILPGLTTQLITLDRKSESVNRCGGERHFQLISCNLRENFPKRSAGNVVNRGEQLFRHDGERIVDRLHSDGASVL